MSDDLTRALAEALGCEDRSDAKGDYYCREHGEYLDHNGRCPEATRIAAALAPLIEARVREARAWGAAGALTALAHEVEDFDAADLATYRAMQWEAEAEEVRRG